MPGYNKAKPVPLDIAGVCCDCAQRYFSRHSLVTSCPSNREPRPPSGWQALRCYLAMHQPVPTPRHGLTTPFSPAGLTNASAGHASEVVRPLGESSERNVNHSIMQKRQATCLQNKVLPSTPNLAANDNRSLVQHSSRCDTVLVQSSSV